LTGPQLLGLGEPEIHAFVQVFSCAVTIPAAGGGPVFIVRSRLASGESEE
jgi:hypothetical protein